MIETAVEIVRGMVPEPHSSRMHSETFRLRNHPSRHRKERDNAALLTQEGGSQTGDTPRVLQVLKPAPNQGSIDLAKPNLNSCA